MNDMGYHKLNQKIILGIGVCLFVLFFSTIFYNYQLVYKEETKLQVFETIETDLTSAQAVLDKYNDSEHGLESLIPKPSLAVSKEALQDFLQYPSLLDRLLRVLSKPQRLELQTILEQISNYESIKSQEAYHALLNQTKESFFITYHNKIEEFQTALTKNTTVRLMLVHSVQLVLMGILLLYFMFSYIFIKRARLIKQKLEDEKVKISNQLKENNYFLEQAQEISKIGYYTYSFKDNTYRASKFILSTLGLPDKLLNLQTWIDCILPNDQIILTSILEKRLLNPDIPLDVTYRIIRPKDGALRWIHHVADAPVKDNDGKLEFALGVIQDITEQKESALKLLNLNQIIASSLNEIYILNYENGALIEVNDAVIFNLGYPKEVVLELNIQDIAPEMTSKTLEDIRIKLTKTKTVVFESYYKRQNGLSYPVEIHIQKGKNDDIDVFLALVIDISERNQAKQSLLESENRWKLAIESTNDGLWDINFKTNTYYYSKRWKEMLGYQEHEILNEAGTWEALIHPDDKERVKFISHLHYDNKTPYYRAEYRMLCKDGFYKWILDRGSAIERNEAKKPVRVIGVHTDISDRKALEESLFNKSELLAKSIDNTPLGFILLDINSIILDWNHAAETIFGYSKQEALGKNILDLIVPDALKSEIGQVRNRFLEESGGTIYQNENQTKSGKRIICNWHNAPLKDNNNQVTGFISLVEDVTEQSLVENAVKQIETITNSKSGDAYYQSLALELNKSLLADYVIIGLFDNANYKSNSLVYTNKQTILPNISYNLKGTPCEIVLGDGYCIYLNNVASMFKTDRYLKENHIEAYLGMAIYNNKREIIGDLVAMYCQPIAEYSHYKTLLKLFADKIGIEIERNNLLNSLYAKQEDLESAQEMARVGNFNLNLLTNKGIGSKNYGKITEIDITKPVDFYEDWRPIVHPDDAKGNKLELENAIKTAGTFNRDFRIITKKTKTVKWLHSNGHIVFKDGIATNFIGSIQDITERKLTENLIKNREQELLNAQKIAHLGSFNLDLQTMKGHCSEIFGQLTELDTTKPIDFYKEWRALVYPADVSGNQKALEKSVNTGAVFQRDYRIITKNTKTLKWIHSIGEILYKAGKAVSFTGTIQDVTESKLAEEKLKQSDLILNRLDSIIQVVDEKGSIIYTSPSVETVLGFKPDELLDQGWWRKTTSSVQEADEVRDAVLSNILNSSTLKEDFVHRKIKAKNGEEKIIQWMTSKGVNNTLIFVGIDITLQKRHELINEVIFNITKKANETLSLKTFFNYIKSALGTLINTNNFFIALYDKKTDLISTPYMVDEQDDNNDFPKGKTLTGYLIDTKKSLLATNKALLSLKREKKIKVLGPLSQCWMGVPLIVENEAIGAIVIQSYTDENAYTQKDLTLVELIAANISQVIKQARDFEKINLLNQALIQSDEEVIITDINGAIQYVNPAFTIRSGYAEQEVLGLNPRILKSGEHPSAFYENLWNTILNGKIWHGELVDKRKDGSRYLVEATISPVKDDAGKITHFVAVRTDITEKRKLERDFIHAFIDAQEQEKISFGEDLHDGISQILSAETMYVEVLNKLYKSDDPRVLDALAKIRALNLSAITDARNIAHGLMSKQLKESGLIIAVGHICEDYNQSKKIKFNFKNKGLIEDEISKEVKINLFRITQEISTNIIRHSGAKNTEISFTKTDQNQLQLIVKDDGVGIDLEKMEREHKGAGLKNIERRVTLLNGKLKLETAPNQGTCYTITVPLKLFN